MICLCRNSGFARNYILPWTLDTCTLHFLFFFLASFLVCCISLYLYVCMYCIFFATTSWWIKIYIYIYIYIKKKSVETYIASLMASVGESQVADITSVWYLSITEWRLVKSINHNVMLLQQFLTAIRQISSKFFIFLQAGAWVLLHRALKTINFSP